VVVDGVSYIVVLDRVRHPIAQSYPPSTWLYEIYAVTPPWQGGAGGVITSHFTRVKSAISM